MVTQVTLARARRIALTAQGFARPRVDVATSRHVTSTIKRLGQFQIDSVTVVARAHRMPLFSRLGAYPHHLLADASERSPRRLTEYWGHAASLIDVDLVPALRMRMAAAADTAWGSMRRVQRDYPHLVDEVRTVIAASGPLTARQVDAAISTDVAATDRTNWGWNWSVIKTTLEWLLWCGEVSPARRNAQFERVYDLSERIWPRRIVDAPTPTDGESHRILVRRAARALGIATLGCLADYFRLRSAPTRAAIDSLVDDGELTEVCVEGRPAWIADGAKASSPRGDATIVSPFDSVAFERNRLEWLFDFPYRIEIYVPEPQRQFGYYVYPVLRGDRFIGRVDLRANRATGELDIPHAWAEPGVDPHSFAADIEPELHRLTTWLAMTTFRLPEVRQRA